MVGTDLPPPTADGKEGRKKMTDLEMFKKVLKIIRCELEEESGVDGIKIDIWLDELYVGTAYFTNNGSFIDFCNWLADGSKE